MTAGYRNPGNETRAALPERVVALGGGTGLPAVLRGLKTLDFSSDGISLTAIVTMSDDGGSSGRIRRTMGLPPPGDIRNCLVALSEDEDLLAELFQHRYVTSAELEGHSVGNLILAALAERTGCFHKAVEASSRVLRIAGRILPATEQEVTLEAETDDGDHVVGETEITTCGKRVRRISLHPADVRSSDGVIESILEADLVVLGPGSLHTSVVPNIVVPGVADALHRTSAAVVLVANLVSERGEAAGLDLTEHIEVIENHAGHPIVDAIVVNDSPIPEPVLARYALEGTTPLYWAGGRSHRVHVVRGKLLSKGPKLRHEPIATVEGIFAAWTALKAIQAMDGVR